MGIVMPWRELIPRPWVHQVFPIRQEPKIWIDGITKKELPKR